ncbi:Hypothetical protein CINCED_3A005443 [Cinara cedri]|uniref:Uncharacterized protein n=1 Tax=Cinara cedri TaxID=506608 RepID=A0A5E4MZE3_9HEMI|nr:Hypothetical protein CINCED_3A005443 [Cinara cedri]
MFPHQSKINSTTYGRTTTGTNYSKQSLYNNRVDLYGPMFLKTWCLEVPIHRSVHLFQDSGSSPGAGQRPIDNSKQRKFQTLFNIVLHMTAPDALVHIFTFHMKYWGIFSANFYISHTRTLSVSSR